LVNFYYLTESNKNYVPDEYISLPHLQWQIKSNYSANTIIREILLEVRFLVQFQKLFVTSQVGRYVMQILLVVNKQVYKNIT